jgi:Tol biopolymer transport system component
VTPDEPVTGVGTIWSFEPSPDGARMLVTADGSGRHQPWLISLDGASARMIEVSGSVQRCVWHPDGERFIALVDPDGREDNQLVLADPATGA